MRDLHIPSIDPHSYRPLREQIYEILRQAILSGNLKPGQQITEIDLAEKFRVSRTPAREAIRMLEQEGFIVIIPRKGAFISGIKSMKEIVDIFQVRIVLESLAASLAAKNINERQINQLNEQIELIKDCIENPNVKTCIQIDTAFHRIICEASENELLQKILDNLFEQITRFRASSLATSGRLKQALTEHGELAQAITKGDSQLAQSLAIKHLEKAQECVLGAFQKQN